MGDGVGMMPFIDFFNHRDGAGGISNSLLQSNPSMVGFMCKSAYAIGDELHLAYDQPGGLVSNANLLLYKGFSLRAAATSTAREQVGLSFPIRTGNAAADEVRSATLHRLFGVPLAQPSIALSFVPEEDGGLAANVLMLLRVVGFEYGHGVDGAFPSTFDGSRISVKAEAAAMRLLARSAQRYIDDCGSTLQEDEELLSSGSLPINEIFVLEVVAGEKRAATRVREYALNAAKT
jgi:hypothetical protein